MIFVTGTVIDNQDEMEIQYIDTDNRQNCGYILYTDAVYTLILMEGENVKGWINLDENDA